MVHKKGPLRSLSIVVDPTHRLLTDESDRVRAGRIVLDGAGVGGTTHRPTLPGTTTVASSRPSSSAIVPPSPSPNGSFIIQQQNADHPPLADSVAGGSAAPDPAVPVGDSLRQPFTLPPRISVVSSPDETPSPSLPFSSFSQSLAARRRSSVVSLPPLPPNSHSRARNDSITSLASISQPQSRAAAHRRTPSLTGGGGGGGRAEEDGFSYLNSAASSQSALSNISMPAPYQHGPIQVLPGIWLGCEENARDWESLKRCNIGSILNVAKEISNVFGSTEAAPASSSLAPPPPRVRSTVSTPNLSKFSPQPSPKPAVTAYTATFHPADPASGRPDLHYLHLPWSHGQSDLVSNGFPQAFAFADESIVKRGKGVLVHCQCGVSRSATLVIALVMRAAARPDATEELKNIGTSMHGAYEFVKEKSVCIGPNMSLIYQLLEYEKRLHPTRPALVHTNTGTESDSAASIHSSPVLEDPQYASEEDRIRAEEEQWARMRKQMEEEEEREREESLRAITVNVNAPRSLVDEEEEAMNLDRAMEERLQLRRQSSVASASVASSSSSTGLPTWKTRFGGAPHRRVRAGSVESNFTGRSVSMVSVEEEDEEEDEQDGGERKVSRKWTIKKPTALRSRTVSTATSSAVSDADADVEEDRMDWRSSTLHHQDQPPLSANTTNTNASSMLERPLTPHLPGGAGAVGVQIVVEDATPLANRHLGGASMMMALDSPTPRRGKRGGMSFDLGLGLPPPSASHFKTSFGAPDLPPPSASHVKMSFGAPPIPPPSASHMKTSFGAPQPPSASHTKMSFGAPQPPTASQLRMSFESDEDAPVPFPSKKSSGFGAQLAAKRAAKKAKMTLLEPVPSSPPVAMVAASPPKSMMSMLERRSSAASVRSSSSSSAGSFRFGVRATSVVERSPSPPTVELVNAEADMDVGGSRKRTKSRPVPAPLALKRAATSSSSSSLEPSAAYVLSSGHRSKTSSMSSTSSSSSSSSSANRLRNKLLNRVSGGRASPATPHPAAAAATTPHQTLFIFPPSPTGSSTLPSSTPSAMMLTTNYRQHNESSSIPMLTPTPTLATFMSGEQQRRRNVSRKASSSSSSSNGGGWMGGMPSTPTTACARVDARGWVGR